MGCGFAAVRQIITSLFCQALPFFLKLGVIRLHQLPGSASFCQIKQSVSHTLCQANSTIEEANWRRNNVFKVVF
ncbi:hypothetical protein ACFFP9_20140 [Rhizobium paknamense]